MIFAFAGVGSCAPWVFEIATIREKLEFPTDATKYEIEAPFSNKSQVNFKGFSLSISIFSSSFHTKEQCYRVSVTKFRVSNRPLSWKTNWTSRGHQIIGSRTRNVLDFYSQKVILFSNIPRKWFTESSNSRLSAENCKFREEIWGNSRNCLVSSIASGSDKKCQTFGVLVVNTDISWAQAFPQPCYTLIRGAVTQYYLCAQRQPWRIWRSVREVSPWGIDWSTDAWRSAVSAPAFENK